ncbi:hypothetical protein GGI20_004546 [Coemansia sp. BCRC 34301]|nr:hypothetical protein GGI20_004546 [Coemansia sp. BCRC 34301]
MASTQRASSDSNNGGATSQRPQHLQLVPPNFQQHQSDQYLQSQLPTSELAALRVNDPPLASAPATLHPPSAYSQPASHSQSQPQHYGGQYGTSYLGNAEIGAEVDNGFDGEVGYSHYQSQNRMRGSSVTGNQPGQRLSDPYAVQSQVNSAPGSSGASSIDEDDSSSGSNALPQPRKPGIGLHQFASQPKLNSLSDGAGAGDFAIPRPRPRIRPGRSSLAPESSLNGEPNPFLTYSRNSIYSSSQTSLSRGSMYGLNSTANMTSKRMSRTLVSGNNALDMYREAAKKTQDENIQLEYAKFLIQSIENLADPVVREDVNVTYSIYFPGNGGSSSGGGMTDSMISPGFGLASASASTASLPLGQQASEIDPENREKLVTEAVYWIKHLQRKGNTEASYIAGTWFETGRYGIGIDKSKAIQLFTYAAKNHHASAAFKVGQHQEERKSSGRAFSYYQMAAALGDVSANYRMARVYLDGDFGKKANVKQALVYLRRSAELASSECYDGAYTLGIMYLKEYPNPALDDVIFFDAEEAQKLLDKAARLGSADAQFKLGYLFELGNHGFPVDPRLSTYYYQLAAEQDHAEAQMALSGWYVSGGEGVFINDQLAFDWGHRAAQQGYTRAIFAMGYYYEMGVGCEPDINQANEWYARAAAAGSEEAKERLSRGNVVVNPEGTAALRRHVTQRRQKNSSASGRGKKRGGLLGRDRSKDGDKDKDKDSTNCIIM